MAARTNRLAHERRRRLPLGLDEPCTLCGFDYAQVAYYVVRDQYLLGMHSREGLHPVRLCRRCESKRDNRRCAHCHMEKLYSADTPLEDRPVAYWFDDCRGRGAPIAPACIKEACDEMDPACFNCHAREWQAQLYSNTEFMAKCEQCMRADGLAPCVGDRGCTRLVAASQLYCGECQEGRPPQRKRATRCTAPQCFAAAAGTSKRCVDHAPRKRH